MSKQKNLWLILLSIGLIWIRSSYGKLSSGNFITGLAKTLQKFAEKNPYPWYKDLLINTAIPNSAIFGPLIMWGEALVAVLISLASIYMLLSKPNTLSRWLLGIGLLGGILLNIIFWLAAGWTSASTDSLNMLMFLIELIGLCALVRS